MNLRVLFLSGVLVSLCVQAAQHPIGPPRALRVRAWHDACLLSKYKCDGIGPPRARFDEKLAAEDLYGQYIGGGVVWIRPGMSDDDTHVVLVHEMVHYLQDRHGYWPSPNKLHACRMEAEAWQVSNIVAYHKVPLSAIYRPNWAYSYGCVVGRIDHGPAER